MKTINYIPILLTPFFFGVNAMLAQDYKIPVENTKAGKLTLVNFPSDIPIQGYNGKEIIITPTSVPEQSKGSKPNKNDNTGIGLEVEKDGAQVTITSPFPFNKGYEYKMKVPDNFSLNIKNGCETSIDISVADMKNEIAIENCQDIHLKNVSGSVVLSTISGDMNVDGCTLNKDETFTVVGISGDIKVRFNAVSTKEPITLTAVSGDIDVKMPEKIQANLSISNVSGSVYSDFDFPKGEKQLVGTNINSTLNGGGPQFTIVNVSGNIYIRKIK